MRDWRSGGWHGKGWRARGRHGRCSPASAPHGPGSRVKGLLATNWRATGWRLPGLHSTGSHLTGCTTRNRIRSGPVRRSPVNAGPASSMSVTCGHRNAPTRRFLGVSAKISITKLLLHIVPMGCGLGEMLETQPPFDHVDAPGGMSVDAGVRSSTRSRRVRSNHAKDVCRHDATHPLFSKGSGRLEVHRPSSLRPRTPPCVHTRQTGGCDQDDRW